MTRYRVTAPLVIAHDHEGRAHHRYEGSVIPFLTDVQREHLLATEMVEEIPDATPPGVVPPMDPDVPVVVYDEGNDAQPATVAPSTDSGDGSTPVVSQPAPENPETNSGQSEKPARPPQIANKETWVSWAVDAHGLSREAAEGMTLNDLKALD